MVRVCLLAVLLGANASQAAIIDVLLERFQKSEFAFGRVDSNAPFPPVGWVAFNAYDESKLFTNLGELRFKEIGVSQALVAPVWIGRRNMVLLGEYYSWQQVDFTLPRPQRVNINTFMPIAAWLRQVGARGQFGAFIAPEFIDGAGYDEHGLEKYGGYAGLIGVHWTSANFAWIYGGVGLFSPDDQVFLPYLGLLWQPKREWSISLILPWPTITYAPTPDYMFQLGLLPAGATLTTSQTGRDLRVSYDSWNLMFSANRRISTSWWISAAVGWSSLSSFSIDSSGDSEISDDLKRGVLCTLQISLRPPTNPRPSRQ